MGNIILMLEPLVKKLTSIPILFLLYVGWAPNKTKKLPILLCQLYKNYFTESINAQKSIGEIG